MNKYYILFLSKYSKLSTYALSGVVNGLLKILTTLYVANKLSPEDFSLIGIYGSIIYFLSPLLAFGSIQLVAINYIDYSKYLYNLFINKYLSYLLILFFGISVIGIPISYIIFNYEIFSLVCLSFVFSFLTNILSIHFAELIQEQLAKEFFIINLINPVLTILFLFCFNFISEISWVLYLLSIVFGTLTTLIFSVFRNNNSLKYFKYNFDLKAYIYYLKYGFPLMVLIGATWVLNQSDKIIILEYFDKRTLGVYSFAFTLGVGYQVLNRSLVNTYSPIIFTRLKNGEKKINDVIQSFLIINLIALSLGVFLLFIFKDIIIPDDYLDGYSLIFIVFIACAFDGLFKVPGLVLDYYKKNTLKTLILYFIALTFLFLTYIFMELLQLGVYSTVTSLLISNMLLFIISYFISKKIIYDL